MIELHDWLARRPYDAATPWVVLGKGPSFAQRGDHDLSPYHLMGLNNVVVEQPVDIAHIVDLDVVEAVAGALHANCRQLLMPRRPHVDQAPGPRLLEEWFDAVPVLRALHDEGRLIWYNAATAPRVGDAPVIGLRYFSSEAAFNILATMGVKRVRTLGIDGGSGYVRDFQDLQALRNGRPSFDAQFPELQRIVRSHGMSYDPMNEPMRVYVGLDESQVVAARVLEHSIRKHASRPVQVIPMFDVPAPTPKDPANRGRTGFSFSRFHIPKLAGYQGRAMYVDADMQVFSDIAEVFDFDMGDHSIVVTRQDEPPAEWKGSGWFHPGRQMSVMLLDCAKLKDWDVVSIVGDLDAGKYTYQDLMFDMCLLPEDKIGDDLDPAWNHLEHYEPGRTKLLHYTVVPTQPWKTDKNPLTHVWEADYVEARQSELLPLELVQEMIRKRHVRPSLAPVSLGGRAALGAHIAIGKAQTALALAEQRVPALRSERALRIRRRVGRRLLGE